MKFYLHVVGYMGHSVIYNRIIDNTTDRLVELAPAQSWSSSKVFGVLFRFVIAINGGMIALSNQSRQR